VPSFADQLDARLEVKGLCSLKVDIAYDCDSFVIVDAAALGFAVQPDEARDLSKLGIRIIAAANEQLRFSHPQAGGWDHISFCQFAGPLTRQGNELQVRNAVCRQPRQDRLLSDRTGCSAAWRTLSARGLMAKGDVYRAQSIIGSEFVCRIARRTAIGSRPASF
jgi:proline racemase